jgi:SAM-dependent methyltransferase
MSKSKLASSILQGLRGIEIGGSAHNGFGLNTLNVDKPPCEQWTQEQLKFGFQPLAIDVEVATGSVLPFADKEFDFVISSHVIEHFFDPIAALLEWVRVAKRYVYLIVPHVDRTFDRGRPVTTIAELRERHAAPVDDPRHSEDKHWSVWRTKGFLALVEDLNLPVYASQHRDDKAGNGFAVVIGDLAALSATAAELRQQRRRMRRANLWFTTK